MSEEAFDNFKIYHSKTAWFHMSVAPKDRRILGYYSSGDIKIIYWDYNCWCADGREEGELLHWAELPPKPDPSNTFLKYKGDSPSPVSLRKDENTDD